MAPGNQAPRSDSLLDLFALHQLRSLTVENFRNLSVADLLSLPLCESLTYLNVSDTTPVYANGYPAMPFNASDRPLYNRFPNLRTYIANGFHSPLHNLIFSTPSLTELDLSLGFKTVGVPFWRETLLTWEGDLNLGDIGRLKELKRLTLQRHIWTRDDFQMLLDEFPALEFLDVSHSKGGLSVALLQRFQDERPDVQLTS